ncbi:23270_t:CDS:2, partial [Cetraspora pellucida]
MSKLQIHFGQSANVETLFLITYQSNNVLSPLLQLSPISESDLSSPLPQLFLISISDLLLSNKTVKLQMCLNEINHQCSITKSLNTPTYDYLYLISISRYIELLLNGKGVYYDGHKQSDVVTYRREWLDRMFIYSSDMLDIVLEPQLEFDKKEYMQVTHDKYHFYANDRKRKVWIKKNEDLLRSKHPERSIMVSDLLCPCHGLLQLFDEQMIANPHIKYKKIFVL